MGALNEIACEKGIPLDVQWELTHRCNLRCSHCYITHEKSPRAELTLEEIDGILAQLADAGALFLTLTGGEALMRPDFFDILAAARRRSFAVVLFSNGTLIGRDTARKLAELSVVDVGISIYGATAGVHDPIMGVPGSFERSMAAIRYLREFGVKVTLKSVIIKENFHQFLDILALAESLGIRYILDPIVSPRNDGDLSSQQSQLSVEQVMELYTHPHFYPEEAQGPWQEGPEPTCYAGRNMVAVNPYGDVLPCVQFMALMGNLREKTFAEIWAAQEGYRQYKDLTAADLPECLACEIRHFCGRCPGMALLETGSVTKPCPAACLLARVRRQIHDMKTGGI